MARRAVHHGFRRPLARSSSRPRARRTSPLQWHRRTRRTSRRASAWIWTRPTLRWAVTGRTRPLPRVSLPCEGRAWVETSLRRLGGLRTGTSRGDSERVTPWGELFSSSIRNGPSWFICSVHDDGDGSKSVVCVLDGAPCSEAPKNTPPSRSNLEKNAAFICSRVCRVRRYGRTCCSAARAGHQG